MAKPIDVDISIASVSILHNSATEMDSQPTSPTGGQSAKTDHHEQFRFVISSGGFLVDFLVIWPFIFCAFSFAFFFALHPNTRDKVDGKYQIPTLSQTGRLVPESLFFTYGLHLEGFLLCLLFTYLYVHIKNKVTTIQATLPITTPPRGTNSSHVDDLDDHVATVPNSSNEIPRATVFEGIRYFFCCMCIPEQNRAANVKYLDFWNRALLGFGLVAAVSMTLVGTFTLQVSSAAHNVVAFLMFVPAVLHMILYYFAVSASIGYTLRQIYLLRAALFVCVPFNIFLFIMIVIMDSTCNNEACKETPIQMIIALEYTTTLALLAYIYSFREALQDINLLTMQEFATQPVRENETEQIPEISNSVRTNSVALSVANTDEDGDRIRNAEELPV